MITLFGCCHGESNLFRGLGSYAVQAVALLASDESSYVSGIELFVDGGMAKI